MDSLLFVTGLTTFALGAALSVFAWSIVRQSRRREAARTELLTGLAFPDGVPDAVTDLDRSFRTGDDGAETPRRMSGILGVDEFRGDEFLSEQPLTAEALFSEPEKSGAASRRTIALAAVAVVMTIAVVTFKMVVGTTASAAEAPSPEPPASATTVSVTQPVDKPADPRVELLALDHSVTPAAFLVTGRVRNPVGGAPLHDVVAVVHVLDRADRVIMTVRVPVKRAVLNAGEWSDFSASASKATNVARYRVEFNARELASIPQIDRRQAEASPRSGQ
jgi:hypothetical protein